MQAFLFRKAQRYGVYFGATLFLWGLFFASSTWAQNLPGSADPSRVKPLEKPLVPGKPPSKLSLPQQQKGLSAPKDARKIRVKLKEVRLEGVTGFSESELADIYAPYIGRETTLDVVWGFAQEITERYQNEGYFLSRAFVPAQEIAGGIVTIRVVEGYIEEVELAENTTTQSGAIQRLISQITAKRPLSAYDLEGFMLQLNALPGQEFRGVVAPLKGAPAGGVQLVLSQQEEQKTGAGLFSFDNYGSRFLGPYQATLTYQDSFLPFQLTTLSVMTSTEPEEIKYGALRHAIPIYPDWTLELSTAYVRAQPGASLKPSDIESSSLDLGLGLNWQPIRQRQKNLIASLELTGKNSNGDILDNNPLTRDRIRVARARVSYDVADGWQGYNYASVGVNRGLGILGASEAGAPNLSRAEAEPDFTVGQFSYTRQQAIGRDFVAIAQFAGQYASGPLFSAEEFGYGGQAFGRAYDPSEIIGDHGIASSLELRYQGLAPLEDFTLAPYAFYDIGKVWNEDVAGVDAAGASAGLGLRAEHSLGFSGNLGLAWPLTRAPGTPIYGNGKSPRIMLQFNQGF